MEINVCTTNRPVNYLASTLESLSPLSANVFVGHPDATYVPAANNIASTIEVGADWDQIKDAPINIRGAWNYRRCLANATADVLVFEDDIILATGWQAFLEKAIADIPEEKYLLSLYTIYPLEDTGARMQSFPNYDLGGTQAVYYPASVRQLVADKLQSLIDTSGGIWDWAIRDFARANDIPIYVTYPNLVQHVGVVSTIGDYQHSSPNFAEQV